MNGLTGVLTRRFVKNSEQVSDPAVRRSYGTFSGAVGICLNILLAIGKMLAGLISGSLAMTADAMNNLTDAGSSIVTLIGFRLAGQKADADHPFGHGRAEYVSGFIVSILILMVGFELGRSSVEKIFHPTAVTFSWAAVGVLIASVLVKLWMWSFNRALGKRISSAALEATASDSLNDAIATTAVLLGTIAGLFLPIPVDGVLGLAVAVFIFIAGINAARDTLTPLMGQAPDPELVENIQRTVLECPEIVGVHDLVIHDYGPGRVMASLHAEVPMGSDILAAHDAIDAVERRLMERYQVETTIHMDPISTNDERVQSLRIQTAALVRGIDPELTIHDFRITDGPLHTNLVFDVVLPFESSFTAEELVEEIKNRVSQMDGRYYAVVEVDRPYAG